MVGKQLVLPCFVVTYWFTMSYVCGVKVKAGLLP